MKDKEYHTYDFKLNLCCTLVQFRNHMYDFSPNCTPLSSITTMNWTPLSPIKPLQIRLYLLWSLVAIFSPSQNKREKNKETNQPTKIKKHAKTWPNQNKKTTKINHTIQSVRCCNGRTFICGPSVTIYMELILAFSCSLLSRSSAIVSLTPLPLGRDTCGLLVLPMMKMLLIRVANWWPVLSFTWTMSNEPGNDVHLLSYWLNNISLKAFSEANILCY